MAAVLLIGGHGFIGSNLAFRLVAEGHEVRLLCRQGAELANLAGLPVTVFHADLNDPHSLETALAAAVPGCQSVFNLATSGSPLARYKAQRQRINVAAAAELAAQIRKLGGVRLVHVSSSTAVGFPFSGEVADEDFSFNAAFDHYAWTKRQGEEAVLGEVEKGLDAVIAIPCSTIGLRGMKSNQQAMVRKVMAGKSRLCPPGGLCLTDVADLVEGLLLCADKGKAGRRYILGGHNIRYSDYLGEIARAAGSAPPPLVLPRALLPLLGRMMEVVGNLTGKDVPVDRNVARMIASNLYYSSQRAETELGYRISDWRQTLQKVVAGLAAEENRIGN